MEKEKIDIAFIEKPATDGMGIYLFDKNPLKVARHFMFSEPTQLHADNLGPVLDEVGVHVPNCEHVNSRAAALHDPALDMRGEIVVELIGKKNLTRLNYKTT